MSPLYFKKFKIIVFSFSLLFLFRQVQAEVFIWQKPQVKEIFSFFPTASNSLLPEDFSSLNKLNKVAQKYFLRPKGEARNSPASRAHSAELTAHLTKDQTNELITLFKSLNMITEIMPKKDDPDYILIYGSTVNSMRKRIMFVAKLIEKNLLSSTPEIIILTGDRSFYEEESDEVLKNPSPYALNSDWIAPAVLPTNENELGTFLWNQLDLPAKMRELSVRFIKSPKKEKTTRATTQDTIEKWLTEVPPTLPVQCWVVSSNPYIPYQEKVTERTIKMFKHHALVTLEGIGPEILLTTPPQPINLGTLLDTLARILYEELALSKL